MTKVENELDEYGKKVLAPLRLVPPMDLNEITAKKAKFLLQGENLRQDLLIKLDQRSKQGGHKPGALREKLSISIFKALVITLLVLVFIAGSSFTVYASQSSLPGEPLYTVKSLSEDVRLSFTFSKQAKLNLTLDYTTRRIGEIRSLVSAGKSVPEQSSDRYQMELEDALQLAAQMNDQQLVPALNEIKISAEDQGMSVDELISGLPEHASPAIVHLQQRIREQVQLSTIGEKDPQVFRSEIRGREHNRHGPKQSPTSELPGGLPIIATVYPMPSEADYGGGDGMEQTTQAPDHSNQGKGQSQSTPGNGNHSPGPTQTP